MIGAQGKFLFFRFETAEAHNEWSAERNIRRSANRALDSNGRRTVEWTRRKTGFVSLCLRNGTVCFGTQPAVWQLSKLRLPPQGTDPACQFSWITGQTLWSTYGSWQKRQYAKGNRWCEVALPMWLRQRMRCAGDASRNGEKNELRKSRAQEVRIFRYNEPEIPLFDRAVSNDTAYRKWFCYMALSMRLRKRDGRFI